MLGAEEGLFSLYVSPTQDPVMEQVSNIHVIITSVFNAMYAQVVKQLVLSVHLFIYMYII